MAYPKNGSNHLTRYGHDIHHQQVSGNATVHNGDNNYRFYYENVNATHEGVQNLLPRADGAQINSLIKEHEPSCLPGTRLEVLQEIKTWAEDGSDKRCVFWLSGMAGTGKSTIARTVAREHLAQNQLGTSFFFSKGGGDVGNARKFFTTIAFQLTQRSPALKAGILKAVNENLDIGTLREQWELLILRPLALLRPELPQNPLLLVIDALDECEGERDIRLILHLLASAHTNIPTIQLRVLVTSRPDTPIRLGFRENPGIWHRDLVLNEVPREVVDHDIAIYFSEELKDIRRQLNIHIIDRLVDKACGLFIWAATACRFIKSGKHYAIHAPKRLSIVLEGGTDKRNPEKELDLIYTKILSESVGETQEKDDNYEVDEDELVFDIFRRVVGSIVILFEPLSINALGSLLGTSASGIQQAEIEEILSHLLSVLKVPASSAEPIRLLHPSFRDFLLSEKRCQETQLQVDEKHAHRKLVDHCLGVMSSSLRRDICGLKRPGSLLSDVTRSQVEQFIRPELQYACLYWIQHLQKSDIPLHDEELVHHFLRKHLLHWLEALAWLERTSEAILALISLEGQIGADKSPRLHEVVRDAKRFAVYNRRIIEEAPLQLYCSALIFAPQNSIIRRQFHQDIPGWIQIKPRVEPNWSASLQTLEGHSGTVFSVAFSPDGSSVVSGAEDDTVRLWDVATGAPLQTLEGHSGWVSSVAFSPDGRSVVSASYDRTVRLWDLATGAPLQTLQGHSGQVNSVAFSPDGRSVVSGSDDETVRLWDAATGAPLQTLESHCGTVWSVDFSPEGGSVLSASDDGTVWLWDAATGTPLQTLESHSGTVWSVAFSPDGRWVLSGSDDYTVRLRNVATGAALQTLEGHSGRVRSVAFSPDGRSVVSGSDDETVRLWDAATGTPLQTLEGHSGWVYSVAFSPDGSSVVSGADDDTVRLWDAATGVPPQTLKSHCGTVWTVASSADDRSVVPGSGNDTLRLWNAAAGAPLQKLEGHSAPVLSVAFSPDGRSVVSGSDDETVRLWDLSTGAPLQTFKGHSAPVVSVAFCLDGRTVVSGSDDGMVWLWNVAMGAALQTLEGHSGRVNSVAFSPDGTSVVSVSDDGTVRLWDAATGAPLQTLEGHSSYVWSAAFSPDGRSVVSGSQDETVRLWDAATGAPLQKLEGHSGPIWSVAFSPDGRSVVSGSDDKTLRFWDAATGAPLQNLEGHSAPVLSVFFSPDGRSIVSESHDDMVRLWDTGTGAPLQTLEGRFGDVHSVDFSLDGKVVNNVFLSGNWIKQGEEKIIWLHPDHRGGQMGTHMGTVVLAQPSGRILIMRFKSGPKVV